MLERYAAGESEGAIAASLGVAPSSVYRVLRERGVLRSRREAGLMLGRGQSQPEPERKDRAPEMREIMPAGLAEEVLERDAAGEAPRLLGLVLGVPGNRVYRLLRGAACCGR